MSVKIYQAYRTEIKNTRKAIDFLANALYGTWEKTLIDLFDNNTTSQPILEAQNFDDISEEDLNDFVNLWNDVGLQAYCGLQENIKEKNLKELKLIVKGFRLWTTLSLYLRDRHQLPCKLGLGIYFDEDWAYLIPSEFIEKEIEIPDYLKDYYYWNNTDKPENVSDEEWEEREKAWKPMLEFNFYDAQVEIIDLKKSYLSKNVSKLEEKVMGTNNTMFLIVLDEITKLFHDYWDKNREEKRKFQ